MQKQFYDSRKLKFDEEIPKLTATSSKTAYRKLDFSHLVICREI